MRPALLALALGSSLLAGCGSKSTPPPSADPPGVAPTRPVVMTSDRCEGVRDLVIDTVIHQLLAPAPAYVYATSNAGGMDKVAPQAIAEPRAEDAKGSDSGAAGPTRYTTTNVQERNVDEADLVKTDGKYVYTLRNNELLIAKTWPIADTALAARVAFTKLQPRQLYLHGDQVIVQGVIVDPQTGQQMTRVVVIDARDRSQPTVESAYDLDGETASSRVVGDDMYFVQGSAVQIPPTLYELAQRELSQIPRADQQSLRPWEVQARLARTLRQVLRANLTESQIADSLPQIRSDGLKTTLACSDLYVPQDNVQLGLTAVARISLADQHTDLVGAMVSGGTVYASTEALYVAAPVYEWNPQGAARYRTAVHEFSLHGKEGRPAYVASGSVDGQLLNQFSMSEWNGDLRIATTDWSWNGQQGGNQLFVLRAHGRSLDTIGAIHGLAKGERIYAGRMFGDKGYLVTFRQTDPLFTLDLSDPTRPRVAGELHINGFSSYLHPMGNDLLLAVGQDATDDGRVTGLQLQVFDVSDPSHPTRKFQEKLSSWSTYQTTTAAQDHHAFTFDPASGTLAIPAAGQTGDGVSYSGLIVYGVDPRRGFTLYGRVSHHQLATEVIQAMCDRATADPWDGPGCDPAASAGMLPAYAQIDRSIVIDNYLVSLGQAGLEIHSLDKLSIRAARLRWPLPSAPATTLGG